MGVDLPARRSRSFCCSSAKQGVNVAHIRAFLQPVGRMREGLRASQDQGDGTGSLRSEELGGRDYSERTDPSGSPFFLGAGSSGNGRECTLVEWSNGPTGRGIYSRPCTSIPGLFSIAGVADCVNGPIS